MSTCLICFCRNCNCKKTTVSGLLQQVVSLGYEVSICPDIGGGFRVGFMEDGDTDFTLNPNAYYQHHHLGYPDCPPEKLEKDFKECLAKFIAEDI